MVRDRRRQDGEDRAKGGRTEETGRNEAGWRETMWHETGFIVRPSGAKRTTISSVQSSYVAMAPKMADKADPS